MSFDNKQTRTVAGKVQVGERAPDFTLPDQKGKDVRLSDLLGKKNIVLYFYPKDDTSGCTAEACSFRDSYEVFKDAGAEVLGVSSDTVDSHQRFAMKHRLPYILLSDAGGTLRKQYGVPATFGLLRRAASPILSTSRGLCATSSRRSSRHRSISPRRSIRCRAWKKPSLLS